MFALVPLFLLLLGLLLSFCICFLDVLLEWDEGQEGKADEAGEDLDEAKGGVVGLVVFVHAHKLRVYP